VRAERDNIDRLPIIEADLKAALRVQAFQTDVGAPREILVQGYEPPTPTP
jgi:hypothetical protein